MESSGDSRGAICQNLLRYFKMKPVQKPVRKRGDHQPCDTDESETREKGITRSKNLGRIRTERIDWTHAAQNHGRIQKRVDPAQPSDVTVSEHAHTQSDTDQKKREQHMARNAAREFRAAQ